jgi:hypothetical protein
MRYSQMNKRTIFLPIFYILAITAFAPDPLKVAPQAYKFEFETEWVKVVRVHYGPYEKIPATKRAQLESPGSALAELLRFEFKTGPADITSRNPKANDHPHD